MDRTVHATVRLGNGLELDWESLYQPSNFPSIQLPIFHPGENGLPRAKTCSDGWLDGVNVWRKIVLDETGGVNTSAEKGDIVKKAGSIAMILMNRPKEIFTPCATTHIIPCAHLSFDDGIKNRACMKSSRLPIAGDHNQGDVVWVRPSIACNRLVLWQRAKHDQERCSEARHHQSWCKHPRSMAIRSRPSPFK